MAKAAMIDNPAPDNVASVKSLGIFLEFKDKNNLQKQITNQMINAKLHY